MAGGLPTLATLLTSNLYKLWKRLLMKTKKNCKHTVKQESKSMMDQPCGIPKSHEESLKTDLKKRST